MKFPLGSLLFMLLLCSFRIFTEYSLFFFLLIRIRLPLSLLSIVTLATLSSFCVALSSVRRAVLSGAMLWQKWSVLGVAMASLLPSCLLLVEQISRRKKRFRLGGNVSVKIRDRGNYFFGRGGDLRQLKLCLVIKLNYRLARSVVTK